jgi:hypothetical protein
MYSTRCCSHILIKLEFSQQIFENYSHIKFHENPSSGSRFVPCEQTNITKLIVAFRNFANAPQNIYATCVGVLVTCGLVFTVFVLFRLCIFIIFMLLFNFVSYVL